MFWHRGKRDSTEVGEEQEQRETKDLVSDKEGNRLASQRLGVTWRLAHVLLNLEHMQTRVIFLVQDKRGKDKEREAQRREKDYKEGSSESLHSGKSKREEY